MQVINPLGDSVTPKALFLNRRQFLRGLGLASLGAALAACQGPAEPGEHLIPNTLEPEVDALTSQSIAENYINYYEFSFSKNGVTDLAQDLRLSPWEVEIDGLVKTPRKMSIADLTSGFEQREYIYRHRCVEAWSMVLPWQGFALADLLEEVEILPEARYVAFTSLYRPEEMPGQKSNPHYPWPYTEGLRLDEARHPLSILATGLYQTPLTPQNGAPIRLVVPWKYGFKDIKAITRISFTAEEPPTLWKTLNSHEYGFYANVNPEVDHPRWSQASEIRLGADRRIPTELFNGYKEVAPLYEGMDLSVYY